MTVRPELRVGGRRGAGRSAEGALLSWVGARGGTGACRGHHVDFQGLAPCGPREQAPSKVDSFGMRQNNKRDGWQGRTVGYPHEKSGTADGELQLDLPVRIQNVRSALSQVGGALARATPLRRI